MEFKVRTKKLKGSAGAIRSSAGGLKSARSSIDNVLKNLNLGRGTDEIKSVLRKSTDRLDTISGAAGKIRTNLEAIATQYEVTEAAIKNQRKKKGNAHSKVTKAAMSIGVGASISTIYKKGKNLWNKYKGDPVAVDSGNFILDELDLATGGEDPFMFTRFYNSHDSEMGSLGLGWIHNYDLRIRFSMSGAVVTLDDGSEVLFTKEKDEFVAVGGTATLAAEGEKYRYTTIDEDVYIFDGMGQFLRYEDSNGYGYSVEYSAGQIFKVVRDNGDLFEFTYSEKNPALISAVTDRSGRSVNYEYDGRSLITVTRGDRVERYEYDRSGRLTDVIDGRGIKFLHNEYDDEDRVVRQFFADDSEIRYTYDESNDVTVVREKDESESYHFHDELFRNTENVYTDGTESFEYDANNQITSETDRNGNETKYQYDNRGNVTRIVRPDGNEVNITYQKNNRPVSVSVNGVRKIKNVYDSKGNLIETTDAIGRKTSYKYNEQGFMTEMRSPSGRVTVISYDERNNAVRMDENGSVTFFEYDELNRTISDTDAKGHATRFEYDRFGHLTGIINASGNKRTFRFNGIDKIESMVDYNGAETRLEYNAIGFPVRMIDPLGRVTEDEYDKMWNHVSRKMPNGGVIRAEYDGEGRPVKVTDPLGNETIYEYDGRGNLVFKLEPEGAATEFRYDAFDNLTGVIDPEGNETIYKYDACNNLVYIRNANGGEVHMEYDAADQLIRETDALGQSREYSYNADGEVCKVVDEAGRVTLFDYVLPDKPSRIVFPDGREEYYMYDETGKLKVRSNKQGRRVEYTYDELDRVIEANGDDGEHIVYTYDAMGNMTSVTDDKGSIIRYEYTLTGQLSSVTDEEGNRTEYKYDALDLLTEFNRIGQDGKVQKTQYRRDIAGNVIEAVDPLGFTEKFAYNGRGELAQKTDKDGYLTRYEYNKKDDLESIIYSDGKEVRMKHDAMGRLAEMTDWTGTTRVESDILGRVTKVIYPDNRTAEYTYGKTGERTSIKHPDGRVVRYGYDKALRLSTLKEGDTSVEYGYDEAGRLVSKVFASGLAAKYAYDTRGNIIEMTSTRGGEVLESFKAKYDAGGNRISAERMRKGLPEETGLFEYGYDATGRLTSVSKDGISLREYTYDAFGNRTSLVSSNGRVDYKYDAMNRLLETSGALNETFRYDNRGNVIEKAVDGKVTNTYVYDPTDSMVSARSTRGSATYEYNGLGHRVEDRIRYGSEPEQKIQYTVDMTKCYKNLLERNINGESEAYLFDGTAIAAKGRNSYDFVNDEMGSPVRILGMDGSNAEIYGYDEFGTSLYEEGDLQPFRYTGYRTDPVADMYFAQAREYMPEHGRFAAQDKVKGNAVNPATANNYIYCMDIPFMYYDPDGMVPTALIGAAVGGLVSGGFELGKQIVKAKIKGEPVKINWAKVGTSALGGAIEGGMLGAGCPPAAAAGVAGLFEGFFEAYNVDGKTAKESLVEGVKLGVMSAITVKAGEAFKETGMGKAISKLTDNKLNSSYLKSMKRIKKGCNVKARHIVKGLVGGLIKKGTGYLKPSKWINKVLSGKWNPICYGRGIVDDPRTIVDAF